ncbi:MAG: aldehyde dehydrogenase (NADP(+)) [Sphingobacteriales bacterium]|nr:aldehyde dehydrogenase (NADP(+)) [Sphingobacteriales bacterium]
MYKDSSPGEINSVMEAAWEAFHIYRGFSLKQRAGFMRAIAGEIGACGDALIQTAMQETNLPEARLRGERARTIFQLESYAAACEKGDWLEARIDTALPDKNPPRPDIRKMLVPLGPVVVFGASNFPFAYSTAGGDTASAFAAGCPVIVKAHPAHPRTSGIVAAAITRAAEKTGMPKGIFAHITGISFEVGKALITHVHCKAVGFTGSFAGGKQLSDWASQRPEPIPVFAEMGSVNPVFLLPEKLKQSAPEIAVQVAASITLGVGQFCTNPGLIIGIESDALQSFVHDLGKAIQQTLPGIMLHQGIADAFANKREEALMQENVHLVAESLLADDAGESQRTGLPTIATVDGKTFQRNPLLHKEVFGPYSLVVRCADQLEMLQVARQLEGQLTATLMASLADLKNNVELAEAVKNICGRFILNGVPTGVEVCLSMQHGGPFPASTDSRFGAVGADAIRRFVRPLAFQNWPDELLPEELKNANPLHIRRTVNNEVTEGAI